MEMNINDLTPEQALDVLKQKLYSTPNLSIGLSMTAVSSLLLKIKSGIPNPKEVKKPKKEKKTKDQKPNKETK